MLENTVQSCIVSFTISLFGLSRGSNQEDTDSYISEIGRDSKFTLSSGSVHKGRGPFEGISHSWKKRLLGDVMQMFS